jgi:L-aspartate oxidase
MKHYDYIIVGTGIAGLYTALQAHLHGSVLILTKGSIDDCNTKHAQGGIAAPIGKNDSPELHYKDTIAAGDGLCDPEAVRILCDEATDRIADLIKFGVPFDTVNGEIALTKEAAHSVSRILHAGGDATGEHIETTLSRRIRRSHNIKVLENCMAIQIITNNNRVNSIVSLDCRTGQIDEYNCENIILATGGAGKLFRYTTNSDVATGDGNALAYEAGAELIDMEFFQFHPTALRLPGVHPFLISEAVRGEGGVLRDTNNYRFMPDYTPDADLAPRDVVTRAIHSQLIKTNSDFVYIDVTHLSPSLITTRFPNIYSFCMEHGIDITRDYIPVAPAAHYYMGGVKVDIYGETNIDGLFCAGENACTGVHGANRLASNSLLEVLVFSKRIIEKTLNTSADSKMKPQEIKNAIYSLDERKPVLDYPSVSLPGLQKLLWDNVGIVRDKINLQKTADLLFSWQKSLPLPIDRPSLEFKNILLNARLITESALLREESRGAHYRSDYPKPRPIWKKHIIVKTHT